MGHRAIVPSYVNVCCKFISCLFCSLFFVHRSFEDEELHTLVTLVQPGLIGDRKTFMDQTGKPLMNMRYVYSILPDKRCYYICAHIKIISAILSTSFLPLIPSAPRQPLRQSLLEVRSGRLSWTRQWRWSTFTERRSMC